MLLGKLFNGSGVDGIAQAQPVPKQRFCIQSHTPSPTLYAKVINYARPNLDLHG